MSYIEWLDDFDVHIKKINEQHKYLIDLLNNLNQLKIEGEKFPEVHNILRELSNYSITHFSTEEFYFDEYEFPESEYHKSEHRKFINKIVEFQEQLSSSEHKLSQDMIVFLTDWLKNHILIEDKKYCTFFKSKGINLNCMGD